MPGTHLTGQYSIRFSHTRGQTLPLIILAPPSHLPARPISASLAGTTSAGILQLGPPKGELIKVGSPPEPGPQRVSCVVNRTTS